MRTTQTSAALWQEPGVTVALRSRAVDRAYNEEAWPTDPNGDTLTTFYRWRVQGQVRDNRNVVLSHANVTAPTALNIGESNAAGLYAVYVAAGGDYTMTASHTGYAPSVPKAITVRADSSFDTYLGPPTNLLVNGDFETGGPAPANWLAEGNILPTVRTDAAATGRWGALVGQQWFAPPFTQMTFDPAYSRDPTMSAASDGTLYLAWSQSQSSTGLESWILFTSCPLEQPCTALERVFVGVLPRIAIGSALSSGCP